MRPRCLRDGLGQRFEFVELSYKPYPCCRFNHTTIEAALQLRAKAGIRPEDVRRVKVGLNHQAYQAVCTPVEVRKAPRTIVQAQFSIPYVVACALVDGAVGVGHFTQEALARPDLLAVAQKVDAYVDDDIEKKFGRNVTPALVHIEMADGSQNTLRVDVPRGAPSHPMTLQDFDAKAQDCFLNSARPMPEDGHHQLRAWVAGMASSRDTRGLLQVMTAQVL